MKSMNKTMTLLPKNPQLQKVTGSPLRLKNGFSLIELMVVVAIVAVLATIALPNYRQYMVRSAESEAQAKMQQLQIELESWRANALTYKGFRPRQVNASNSSGGTVTYAYAVSATNNTILVPNATNPKYTITLVDGDDTTGTASLVGGTTLSAGRSWRMLATPNTSNSTLTNASTFLMNSQNLRCRTTTAGATLTITATSCNGPGLQSW